MPKTVEDSTRSIDSLFADLIRILESVPHFRIFWVQLEQFRSEFETFFSGNKGATAEQLANHKVSGGKTLLELAFDTANQISQSAPYAKVILRQLDLNLNHFLLFMHFVMSCLHRQTHLAPEPGSEPPDPLARHLPFAKDRIEKLEDGAARQALERLERLTFYHTQDSLKAFICREKDIPEFNPKPDVEIRKEITAVKEQIAKTKAELQDAERTKASLVKEVGRVIEERDSAQKELNRVCDLVKEWTGEFKNPLTKLGNPFAKRMLTELEKLQRSPKMR